MSCSISFVKLRKDTDNILPLVPTDDGTGFVRLSLVPVDHMMDHGAHEKFAFHYACMDQGSHHCPDRSFDVCGNDAEGLAWKTVVEVPRVYEDGVYVFGWSWYGGGDFRGLSFFGDYYACSFIRIQGGASVEEQFQPYFNGPSCPSSVDRLGVCWSEPCRIGSLHIMVPAPFSNGGSPPPILRTDIATYGGGTSHEEQSVLQGARSNGRREIPPEIMPEKEKKLRVALLNLKTFEKVDLKDGAVYDLADFPRGLTVEAFYDGDHGDIRVIEFYVDDVLMRREYHGPFVMNGNDGRRFYRWDIPIGRMVKVSVGVDTRSGNDEKVEADIQFA